MNWIFPGQVAIVLVYATKLLLASPLVGGSPLILHLTYHSHSLTLTMKHLFIKTLAVKSVAVRFALYTTASYFPVVSASYVGWLIAHHVFLKPPSVHHHLLPCLDFYLPHHYPNHHPFCRFYCFITIAAIVAIFIFLRLVICIII